MNKKISLGLALSLIAIASAVTFILTSFFSLQSFNEKVVDVNEKAKKYSSLQVLDSYVRENYLGDIDEEELSSGILKGYVEGIDDKYSRFLTAEEYQNELSSDSGELVGLGLTLTEDESGYIRIAEIYQDSPVSESDLVVGDIITYVDGNDVLVTGFDESIEAMKGQEGTEITITVRRDGIDKDMVFVRRSMELTSVTGEMLSGYIGYIKITSFKKNTPDQFIETLERLNSNGAKAFIFDLRDNGGGLVSALEECVDPLLPEGIVATAEYKDGHSETLVYSDESELNLPMIVLVNDKTASAGELFAASLKDFGKAQLVGIQTFGKGVMQQTTEFEDGSAVVLTVAEYKTAYSECYDGIGLVPDYVVENEEDSETDFQYNKAVEIISKEIQ
ncbi:MAG: S41 family peptidase [Oscillospiraceae bacterium]|nr:S41 family peptidase [Ruminococcus sp.]MDD6097951.1 S41 family peptidase [Oscillospiraceae bacterium]